MAGYWEWRRQVVVTVAAVCVAGVGIAFAAIPDANGVIHACLTKASGSLRVIDDAVADCRPGETPLHWNVQGVTGQQGPPGPAGQAGAMGPQGPAGSSANAFTTVNPNPVEIFESYQVMASLSLPPGNYVVIAHAVSKAAFGANRVECFVSHSNGFQLPGSSRSEVELLLGGESAAHALSTPLHLNAADTIEFVCLVDAAQPGGERGLVTSADLTAMQVATLTTQ